MDATDTTTPSAASPSGSLQPSARAVDMLDDEEGAQDPASLAPAHKSKFDEAQRDLLELEFASNPFPKREDFARLALKLGIADSSSPEILTRMKRWFEHRRARVRQRASTAVSMLAAAQASQSSLQIPASRQSSFELPKAPLNSQPSSNTESSSSTEYARFGIMPTAPPLFHPGSFAVNAESGFSKFSPVALSADSERNTRRRFNAEQTEILLEEFKKNPHTKEFERICQRIGIPDYEGTRVKAWMSNRRQKMRRDCPEDSQKNDDLASEGQQKSDESDEDQDLDDLDSGFSSKRDLGLSSPSNGYAAVQEGVRKRKPKNGADRITRKRFSAEQTQVLLEEFDAKSKDYDRICRRLDIPESEIPRVRNWMVNRKQKLRREYGSYSSFSGYAKKSFDMEEQSVGNHTHSDSVTDKRNSWHPQYLTERDVSYLQQAFNLNPSNNPSLDVLHNLLIHLDCQEITVIRQYFQELWDKYDAVRPYRESPSKVDELAVFDQGSVPSQPVRVTDARLNGSEVEFLTADQRWIPGSSLSLRDIVFLKSRAM